MKRRGPDVPDGPGRHRQDAAHLTGNTYRNSPQQIGDQGLQINTWNLPRGARVQVVGRMPDVGRWIDRENETRQVLARLDPGLGASGPVVVHGPAGVGKTLLVRAVAQEARRAERRWFSGELFIDVDNRPGDAGTVGNGLSRALRLLAVALDRPAPRSGTLDEQRELFAHYLLDHAEQHGRPMLIVVDGATAADQVTPFLPPGGTGRLLVTSRRQLPELLDEHAGFHALDRLAPSDAVALLASVVEHALGRDRRVIDDPEGARAVAEYCDRLPFALMRAAHLLVTRPGMSVSSLRDRLADSTGRLAELDTGDRSVRSTLDESYRLLSTHAQRLLRLLPLHPGPDIGVHAAAALAGVSPLRAGDRLSELHGLCFLERSTGYEGYRFESLVLLYAQERCQEASDDERQAALSQLMDHYEVTARAAVECLPGVRHHDHRATYAAVYGATYAAQRSRAPHSAARADAGLRTVGSALAWLDAERPNLVAAVVRAQDNASLQSHAVSLAFGLTPFFDLRKHWDDWLLTHGSAVRAARRRGLERHCSRLLREIGRAYHQQGLLQQALAHYREAVDAWDPREGRPDEAVSLMYRALSELDEPLRPGGEGVAALESVLEACERRPSAPVVRKSRSGIAAILNNLGVIEARHGDDLRALARHEQAVDHSRRVSDGRGEGQSLLHLGNVQLRRGNPSSAGNSYRRAFHALPAEDRFSRGQAAYNLGLARAAAGDVRETRDWMGTAIQYFAEVRPDEARHEARKLEQQAREAHRLARRLVRRRASLRRIPLKPLSPLVVLPPVAALLLDDISPDTPQGLARGGQLPDVHTASHGLVEPLLPDDAVLAALPVGAVADATRLTVSALPVDAAEERPAPKVTYSYGGGSGSRARDTSVGGYRSSVAAGDDHSSSGSSSYDSSSSSEESYGTSYGDDSASDSGGSSASDYGDEPY
ncbi:tetratricopeptide repeat protein [Streptomyces sp. NBC_01429]|uniref:tetratricopeptide repeat protein n=1 Tax=Streptomyces sp. NBC_01429 TaxID=2903862 RepID=UPI002E2A6587|nr:tetratricopeptide repeat protein [Streptomyces sp. NBC_01429]